MTAYYSNNETTEPSFVVDVTEHYKTKRRALACHKSQFNPPPADGVQTRLTSPRFKTLIESRDAQFGVLAGVDFAAGCVIREPVLRPHLLRDWRVPRGWPRHGYGRASSCGTSLAPP